MRFKGTKHDDELFGTSDKDLFKLEKADTIPHMAGTAETRSRWAQVSTRMTRWLAARETTRSNSTVIIQRR